MPSFRVALYRIVCASVAWQDVVTCPNGNLLVADCFNHCIRVVSGPIYMAVTMEGGRSECDFLVVLLVFVRL